MRSMTGHGTGKAIHGGKQVVVELSTVNRKQFELACSLPRGLSELEGRVREAVVGVIQRGRLTCTVSFESSPSGKHRHSIDFEAAKAYKEQLESLRKMLRLQDSVTLEQVLRGPGVIREETNPVLADGIWPGIEQALTKALKLLVKMREAEGTNLAAGFLSILEGMEKSVVKVVALTPGAVDKHRAALHRRVKEAGVDLSMDDDRLHKEVVFFADKSDVTEEVSRLGSHFQQLRQLLKTKTPIGRTLEFLTQEINREINTIGSKANDLEISRVVMHLKGELEKIREQMANVE